MQFLHFKTANYSHIIEITIVVRLGVNEYMITNFTFPGGYQCSVETLKTHSGRGKISAGKKKKM